MQMAMASPRLDRDETYSGGLDAYDAVGDDADDAADQCGVDDVPFAPEDTTENYQTDEGA